MNSSGRNLWTMDDPDTEARDDGGTRAMWTGDQTLQANGLEAPIMQHQPRRWRIRISTLMLLVIIAAFTVAVVIERRKSVQLEQELASANARRPHSKNSRIQTRIHTRKVTQRGNSPDRQDWWRE
jgi:hypothetical protein